MAVETTILQEAGVTISNARAVFPTKTYAMAQISSVSMAKTKTNGGLVVLGVLFALGGLAFIGNQIVVALIGILIGAGLLYLALRPKYAVLISSSSGEGHALVSGDRALIERVVTAINDAMIHRG